MKINIAQIGRVKYEEVLDIQYKLLARRQQGLVEDTIILVEHPAVITIGKSGKQANVLMPQDILAEQGISVYEVNRGGDVTYHGPGQIVGYPILDLNNHGKDIHKFVWKIEEVIVQLLKEEFGITAGRIKEYTGVWVGNEKITAIGFAVKRWVTMHGFAFNVNTQLEHFKWIVPCGITDKGVTSLKKLLGEEQDYEAVNSLVVKHFCKVFGLEPVYISKQELYDMAGGV